MAANGWSITQRHVPSACRRAISTVTLPSISRVDVKASSPSTTGSRCWPGSSFGGREELVVEAADRVGAQKDPAFRPREQRSRFVQRHQSFEVAVVGAFHEEARQVLGFFRGSGVHADSLEEVAAGRTHPYAEQRRWTTRIAGLESSTCVTPPRSRPPIPNTSAKPAPKWTSTSSSRSSARACRIPAFAFLAPSSAGSTNPRPTPNARSSR